MTNSLVYHKTLNLGIGCISKELSKSYHVNFGLKDVKKCNKNAVQFIDTTECETVSFQEYQRRMLYSDSDGLNKVIVGNELRNFVGIGWVTERVITIEDLKLFPRVV